MDEPYVTQEQFRIFEEQMSAAMQLVLMKLDAIIEEMRSDNRKFESMGEGVHAADEVLSRA